jgi:hypothetical protein
VKKAFPISYFEREGNDNLADVLRILKRTLKRRPELQRRKIIFFTSVGKGPTLAYQQLEAFEPQLIAVTFPPSFTVIVNGERITPTISPKIRKFFDAVGIKVLTSRLPFANIDGVEAHNQQMALIKNTISLFGGGFYQCVQAVLQACDFGEVAIGETVISVTGDCAAIVTASNTENCFSEEQGIVINEILCKPRNLTIARKKSLPPVEQERPLFEENRPTLPHTTIERQDKTIEGKVIKAEIEQG